MKTRHLLLMLIALLTAGVCNAQETKFTDFKAEYNGKVQHLSDYVGKGQHVLAVFWASWCPPCRKEIPHMIEIHNKYKDKNFTVLGIPTNDKPENSKKIIAQMGVPYPQMLNAQGAGAMAYGINSIPYLILFSPDGKIIARGNTIENLEEILSKL